jgi:hypothetical protein
MSGAISTLPEYAFMAWCSVKEEHRDNFTFTFTFTFIDNNMATERNILSFMTNHQLF